MSTIYTLSTDLLDSAKTLREAASELRKVAASMNIADGIPLRVLASQCEWKAGNLERPFSKMLVEVISVPVLGEVA